MAFSRKRATAFWCRIRRCSADSIRSLELSAIILARAAASANAQWLNYPAPRTPLAKDGKPNLSAKTPRTHEGKPDLSGLWQIQPSPPGEIERGENPLNYSRYWRNILIDFKPGEEPLRPEAAAVAAGNLQTHDSPSSRCLPYGLPNRYFTTRPVKILQDVDEIAVYHELDGAFRLIHTDGRKLPVDPFPSWMGYSTAKWVGETLAVDSNGFNDQAWMDAQGHPQSEALRVRERFHRRDFGHLEVEVTIEDSNVLTRPVTLKFTELLIPNSDALENFCAEGERDRAHMPVAIP
jgi:hypothetical protein